MVNRRKFILLVIYITLSAGAVKGQTADINFLPRLNNKIILDGKIDEAAWNEIDPLPLTMYEPVYRGKMTERTEIKVAYDDHHIYVAGKLYYENPEDIRANSLYRDRYSSDDTFAIIIDPFNDDENAVWFFTNPAGVRFDMAVSNDAEFSGGNPINRNWDTFWQVETYQNGEGWFAEMAIPFSSIGLQLSGNQAEIGLIVYRFIAKNNERHIFPEIPPNWSMGNAKPSMAMDVIVRDVETEKPFYLTPYLLSGFGQQSKLNGDEYEYNFDSDATREFGGDIKYNITSNLTLDITANTDFAQVEADNQQVNLSRFALFFPEKRQFFQERSGIFDFRLRSVDQLFFSRRIGLDDDGQAIRILGGTRLTGKVGDWDIGFMNMQTDNNENVPAENFGVLRLKRTTFNSNSYIGGIFTSRLTGDRTHNVTYGLDGVTRVTGNEYLTVKFAQTFYDGLTSGQRTDPFDTGVLHVNWSRRTNQGLYYEGEFNRYGKNFDPGIGFITRHDYTHGKTRLSYARLKEDDSSVRRWDTNLFVNLFVRNTDGTAESAILSNFNGLQFKSGSFIGWGINHRFEDTRSTLSFLPKTEVLPGSYRFWGGFIFYNMAPLHRFRSRFNVSGGQFYDGYTLQASISPTWNVSKHVELGGSYELNSLSFPDRGQRYDAHIIRFRTQGALNRKLSASTFIQFSNVSDLIGSNIRIRYNFGERNDLWLVYNEQLNTDRDPLERELPRLPLTQNRTILLKFTYTFGL